LPSQGGNGHADCLGADFDPSSSIVDWTNGCHLTSQLAYDMLPQGWEATVAAGGTLELGPAYQQQAMPLLAFSAYKSLQPNRHLMPGGLRQSDPAERCRD
jgi:hypothetical protein